MELCYRNISVSDLLWETKIYQFIIVICWCRKIYVSIWYDILLKGISEHTLIQSYISIIISSAIEFQFLFEILTMWVILSSSHTCDNVNIFVKTPYDGNLKLSYQKLSGKRVGIC